MSSIATSSPRAFCRSQRRLGSAAVQRNACSSSRVTVPSSITLPSLVAPGRVDDLSDADLRGVARDDAVDEPRRVGPGDQVLVERRHVDQRGGVADGVVFVLVVRLVRADGVVTRPLAVVEALAERERARVEGGADRHRRNIPNCGSWIAGLRLRIDEIGRSESARSRIRAGLSAMPQRYDVIVIGGGHNGLVHAAYLARAGRRVARPRAPARRSAARR